MYKKTQRDIREFTEGLTVIGGSPYEVDIDSDRQAVSVTVKLFVTVRSLTNIVREVRDFFQMPETDYPVVSILKTKRGIRIRFSIPPKVLCTPGLGDKYVKNKK